MKASVAGISDIQTSLSSGTPSSYDEAQALWNKMEDVKELLQSAGKGVEDIARLAVNTSGCMLLARRDAWLETMAKSLSQDTVLGLRGSDLQGPQLFQEDLVQEAIVKAEKSQSDQRSNKLISGIWDLTKKSSQSSKENNSGFTRKPFNSYNPPSNYSNPGYKSQDKSNRGSYSGRGGRGGKMFERKPASSFQKGGSFRGRGGQRN
jgi:hypothetical protein